MDIHDPQTGPIIHIQVDEENEQTDRRKDDADSDHPRETVQCDLHADGDDAEYRTKCDHRQDPLPVSGQTFKQLPMRYTDKFASY